MDEPLDDDAFSGVWGHLCERESGILRLTQERELEPPPANRTPDDDEGAVQSAKASLLRGDGARVSRQQKREVPALHAPEADRLIPAEAGSAARGQVARVVTAVADVAMRHDRVAPDTIYEKEGGVIARGRIDELASNCGRAGGLRPAPLPAYLPLPFEGGGSAAKRVPEASRRLRSSRRLPSQHVAGHVANPGHAPQRGEARDASGKRGDVHVRTRGAAETAVHGPKLASGTQIPAGDRGTAPLGLGASLQHRTHMPSRVPDPAVSVATQGARVSGVQGREGAVRLRERVPPPAMLSTTARLEAAPRKLGGHIRSRPSPGTRAPGEQWRVPRRSEGGANWARVAHGAAGTDEQPMARDMGHVRKTDSRVTSQKDTGVSLGTAPRGPLAGHATQRTTGLLATSRPRHGQTPVPMRGPQPAEATQRTTGMSAAPAPGRTDAGAALGVATKPEQATPSRQDARRAPARHAVPPPRSSSQRATEGAIQVSRQDAPRAAFRTKRVSWGDASRIPPAAQPAQRAPHRSDALRDALRPPGGDWKGAASPARPAHQTPRHRPSVRQSVPTYRGATSGGEPLQSQRAGVPKTMLRHDDRSQAARVQAEPRERAPVQMGSMRVPLCADAPASSARKQLGPAGLLPDAQAGRAEYADPLRWDDQAAVGNWGALWGGGDLGPGDRPDLGKFTSLNADAAGSGATALGMSMRAAGGSVSAERPPATRSDSAAAPAQMAVGNARAVQAGASQGKDRAEDKHGTLAEVRGRTAQASAGLSAEAAHRPQREATARRAVPAVANRGVPRGGMVAPPPASHAKQVHSKVRAARYGEEPRQYSAREYAPTCPAMVSQGRDRREMAPSVELRMPDPPA